MSLLEEFLNHRQEKPTEPAKKILFAVLNDLFGRGGLDGAWDAIDEETQEEILATNLEKVRKNLPQSQD